MHIVHLEDDLALKELFSVALKAAQPDIKLEQFLNSDNLLSYAMPTEMKDVDIFVLDIRVPGSCNGVEVANRLRKAGYAGPIVITSVYPKPAKEVMQEGDFIWMAKPWYLADAARTINNIVSDNKTQ